jgi:hypothetical protein
MPVVRPQAGVWKEKSRKDLRGLRSVAESGCQKQTEIKNMNITISIRSTTAKPSLLTGLCAKYKFQREFLDADKIKGKTAEYTIDQPGIYHCRETIETATWRYSNYIRVSDSGEITEITEADAVAEFSLATA